MRLDVRFRCRLCINNTKLIVDTEYVNYVHKNYEFPRCYVCGLYMLPEKLDFLMDWMPDKAKIVLEKCTSHFEIMELLYNE